MSRLLLVVLRGGSIAMLAFLITELGLIYNNDVFNFWEIASILGQLRDLSSYALYIGTYYICYGLLMLVGSLFVLTNVIQPYFYQNFMNIIFENMVGRWFYFPGLDTTTPTINIATDAMVELASSMVQDVYLVVLQILMLCVFFYAIRGSLTSNPGDSIKTIIFMNILIIIPMFFIGLGEIIGRFGLTTPEFLQEIIDRELLKPAIYYDISDDFWSYVTSEIFTVAMLSFVYLELVFQVAYVDQVTSPSIERELRLSQQIRSLKVEAERAVATIKQIEQDRREKAKLAMETEGALAGTTEEEEKALSLRTFMSESGKGRFSYISELIEKKKLEREEKAREMAMKDTRKLNNYLDKLFKQDKEAYNAITAKTSAPSSANLISSTIMSLASRIVVISLIAWAAIHPRFVFLNIFHSPPAIAESVEMTSPEAVLSLFIPFLLIIPLVSAIIRITKHSKLNEMLRLEAIQRSGLTEEELEELNKRRNKVAEQEVVMDQDKDAARAAAKAAAQTPVTPNTNPNP